MFDMMESTGMETHVTHTDPRHNSAPAAASAHRCNSNTSRAQAADQTQRGTTWLRQALGLPYEQHTGLFHPCMILLPPDYHATGMPCMYNTEG
jgi:hypothetical protein